MLRRRCLSADGTTQTAKSSSNSFTELLDVYTMTPSSPSPPDAVSTTHHEVLGRKRLVRISSDRYQVRAAPDLPPGPFQSNPVGDIRSSLLRTMSERRGERVPADVTSQLRPLLLVQTPEAGSLSSPAAASVVMMTRKVTLSCLSADASVWVVLLCSCSRVVW